MSRRDPSPILIGSHGPINQTESFMCMEVLCTHGVLLRFRNTIGLAANLGWSSSREPTHTATFHAAKPKENGPEWTSTHQCTNVDGWCTDRILFSIHVPSLVDFFFFALSQPWSQFFFFGTLFSPPPPTKFFFKNFSHPPATPYCPPLTYSPIYLN